MLKFKTVTKKTLLFIKRKPFVSFFASLGILLFLIILGSFIRRPKNIETTVQPKVYPVKTYQIGEAPRVELLGKVEKSGVITLVAQTAGIITSINVREGETVGKGANLMNISTTYTGASAPALQASIASKQYQTAKETYPMQQELIDKQKEVARKTDENAEELRQITERSIGESRDLLNLNEAILSTIDTNLRNLETATNSAENAPLILSTKQVKSQVLGAINQLRSAIRQTEYQASNDNPPAELATLQKDIALKQLEIQEKTLKMNLEVARINASLAHISASLMHPTAPIAGVVDRIHVRYGQAVNPGTPLITIVGGSGQYSVIVPAPTTLATKVSKLEPSIIELQGENVEATPAYITLEPQADGLHRIIYHLSGTKSGSPEEGQFVTIVAPVGYADASASVPVVPLDAIHQLQDQSYIYVVENDKVISKQITLGYVLGRFVEVSSGLQNGDRVIISRTVTEGDLITVE